MDFAAVAAQAAGLVVGIRHGDHRRGTGVLWRDNAVVASEQSLPEAAGYRVVLPGGAEQDAKLAGRDRGTNVAVLRLEAKAPAFEPAEPAGPGALAMALGSDGEGGITARLGVVHRLGPAWTSMAGGRIDRLIDLDTRLAPREEGGPVLDIAGKLLGISTFGPRRRVLVIPTATVGRAALALLTEGRVPRAWLGLALQPVALPEAACTAAGCESGLMVVSLSSGGPAEQAGILLGDVILAANGEEVGRHRILAQRLAAIGIGGTCILRLLRAGAVQEVSATVGARPE
jgi:S1-C subfamily serine protease